MHNCLIDSALRGAHENLWFWMVKCLVVEKSICFENPTYRFECTEKGRDLVLITCVGGFKKNYDLSVCVKGQICNM